MKIKQLAWLAVCLPFMVHAYDSGSTGADGAFSPTSDIWVQLPASGVFNFTSVTIPEGVTVRFKRNAANTPVVILASGDVTIAGKIDISGEAGAAVGANGDYPDMSDDGQPGIGGPGGFDGGRGGQPSVKMAGKWIGSVGDESTYTEFFGGAGLGPGGGGGGKLLWYSNVNGSTFPAWSGGGLGGSYVMPALLTAAGRLPASSQYYHAFASQAGAVYGSAWLRPLIGGSGGGGGGGRSILTGTGGGGGGGALLIAASGKVSITGSVLANGGNGGGVSGKNVGSTGVYIGGTGGGGAGGAIRIVATQIEGSGMVSALGGGTGVCLDGCAYIYDSSDDYSRSYGSAGSYGRIRLESPALNFSGKSTPTASTSMETYPAASEQMPTLKITSVAGATAPATPSGSIDMVLPTEVTNPVTVNFATTGVPLGNVVKLTVLPAYGDKIEVTSEAVTGTYANGTASVQVNLPAGSSVLMASTTYTLSLAMGQTLATLANNERVEKMTLLAGMGATPQVKLITVSGKEFIVSSAQVAAVLG